MSQIISSCNFLCDQAHDEEQVKLTDMDKFLTRREKYMYERILAEVHHSGSLKRTNAALVILQKIIRNERNEKAQKLAQQEKE